MERETALVPVNANVRNGWLSGELTQQQLKVGEPLSVLIERCFDPALEPFLVAQVNGEFKPDWKNYIPAADDHILVYVLPQGSQNNGKNGLMLIASIVAAYYMPGAVDAMAPLFTELGATVVYAVGISVVMSALTRALFKPPNQQTDDGPAINPFYSLQRASNDFQPFGSVPNIYGNIRYTPAQVVSPDKQYRSDGVYLVVLLDFGYGWLSLTNIEVGQSDIKNHTPDVHVHHNFTKDTPLRWFRGVNKPLSADNALVDTIGVERTTAQETNGLQIELNFPYGLWSTWQNPNTGEIRESPEAVRYEILCRVKGDTTWKSIWDFAIPHAPDNADQPRPSYEYLNYLPNWQPYVWNAMRMNVWDNGLTGDAKVTFAGFKAGTIGINISGDFFHQAGYIEQPNRGRLIDPRGRFANQSLFSIVPGIFTKWAIALDNPLPNDIIFYQWPGPNPPIANVLDANVPWYGLIFNFGPTYPPFRNQNYSFFTFGTWEGSSPFLLNVYSRNPPRYVDTRQNFSIDWRFDFIYANEYDIRIVNFENPSPQTDYAKNNEMRWTTYTSYSGSDSDTFNPVVPHTVLEVRIRASDQTRETVGVISAIATRHLKVWNYKSNQWEFNPTRSPAWAYLDVLQGPANKDPVPDHLIDFDALKEWDEDCTEMLVVNGWGDSKYSCDMIIKGESTVKDVLSVIAATGRAIPCRRDMKHSVIRRQPYDAVPVQLFTQKNTSSFNTNISYIDPPHAIKASFMDELNDYAPNEAIIYDDEYDVKKLGDQAKVATKFEELELPGVTKYHQAWRLGRFYFASVLLERERVSFTVSMEHLIAQRGDLVHITSDYLRAGGLPRRITKVQGDHFWIDEPAQGITTIRFRGTDALIPVTIVSDQEFICASGWIQYLLEGDLIEWGVTDQIKAPYIIEDIQPGADYSATVRAVEFKPEVDDSIDGEIPDREVHPGAVDGFVISAVQNLKLNYPIEIDKARSVWRKYYHRYLTWGPPQTGHVDRYNIYRVEDQAYYWIGSTEKLTYELPRLYLTDVQATVQMRYSVEPVVDLRGNGPKVDAIGVVFPDTTPPADVAWLNLNVQTETVMLFWAQFTELQKVDLSHFEIRYSSNYNANWDEASKLVENVPRDLTATSVPMRVGKYFIKAVDYSGNYSSFPATDETQVIDSSILQQNSVIDLAPFSGGTHDRTYETSGMLRLANGELEGEYLAPDIKALHFATAARIRLTASITVESIVVDTLLGGDWFDPLEGAKPLGGPSQQILERASAQIYFRYKSYNLPGIGYNAWTVLTMADVTATDVEFKVVMQSPDSAITASVKSASISTDWVQRFESSSLEVIDKQSKVITYQNPFATAPSVNVTILNGQPGDWVQIGWPSNIQFVVTLFDANGNWKTGYVSWTAKGYGKLF